MAVTPASAQRAEQHASRIGLDVLLSLVAGFPTPRWVDDRGRAAPGDLTELSLVAPAMRPAATTSTRPTSSLGDRPAERWSCCEIVDLFFDVSTENGEHGDTATTGGSGDPAMTSRTKKTRTSKPNWETIRRRSRKAATGAEICLESQCFSKNGGYPRNHGIATRRYLLFEQEVDGHDRSGEIDLVIFHPAYPTELRKRAEVMVSGVIAAFNVKLTLRDDGLPEAIEEARLLRRGMQRRSNRVIGDLARQWYLACSHNRVH